MKIGLVAGEASGDLLGAGLIEAIKERFPDARFEGVAGPAMTAAGCEQWEPAESLAVMGLIEPLTHIPRLLRLRRELARRWIESPPDVFVGIDAPDFNLGLEKKLRSCGIRTAHYVSPSIWAWRPGRVKKVRKAVDKVLCILPFEPPIYERHGVAASFVGHPRASAPAPAADAEAARRELGLAARTIVAVLPGSRTGEVSRLGGPFAHAAAQLAEARPELHFVTPLARPDLRALVESQLEAAGVADRFTLLDGQSNLAMAAADVVLLASGTAVLEAALLGRPAVAAYKVAPLTHFLVRTLRLVKLTHYTLPNLLTDEPLVPEFIQQDATPEALAGAVGELLDDPQRRRFIRDEFAKLKSELALDADQLAAESVIELARQ
jgi:lipid-A-disaccharide synthase